LYLGWHGEGGLPQAWARVPGLRKITDWVDASKLTFDKGKVTGTVAIEELFGGTDGDITKLAAEFELDAAVDGSGVAGSYSGSVSTLKDGKEFYEFLSDGLLVPLKDIRYARETTTPAKGVVTGVMRSVEDVARGQEFAQGQDWPWLQGPNYDNTAVRYDGELIDNMRDARLVWKSETTPAGRSQAMRFGEAGCIMRYLQRGLAGGGASPYLAEGRVYFQYFEPAGEAVDERTVAFLKSKGCRTAREMWSVGADDVILCLDASTGRTLWKARIPGGRYMAMNGRMGSTKGWYAPQLAVADGHVYVTTTRDVTYCLKAETGELVWGSPMGMQPVRIVVDGVLLPGSTQFVAYDGATGEQLWLHEKLGNGISAPVPWRHDGVTYAIVANRSPRKGQTVVTCVELRTGKQRWQITGVGVNNNELLVHGDFILLNVDTASAHPGKLGAYRISPDKAEKLWELGEDHVYNAHNRPLMIVDDLVLFHNYFDKAQTDFALFLKPDTGEIVKRFDFPVSRGFHTQVGNRAIMQVDATHTRSLFYLMSVDPKDPRQLGEVWNVDHSPTSGYAPISLSQVFSDGRFIVRGARGIFCYDLRKKN
jgi:outer membrane protein assembly factor BamB